MRPTTSTMLQQNNNNNYPCLNVSGSTRDMLQKCSRASLPFPSRLDLGLGDLPLIRGLRAWALCSKNRRKVAGGQAPMAPPAGRGGSTSCPRPADVYLSGEWGRMGYGLPLGLDARQAGLGALVTVATLKTSEGSGKTQTQCLFLRTEKGSCLYSTAKPSSGGTTSAASSVVGGWLRGKTGGGGGGIPGGRKDNGPTPPGHTGVNRVRVRSGRRWRKSNNAREKTGVSRERQQSSREDPAGEICLEERQEEQDKGRLASKQLPSPQQDSRRARQERDAASRSPTCCHNASPRTCARCVRRAQRSQEGHEGGESPRRGTSNRIKGEGKGMRKDMQRNEEEGGLCGLEASSSVWEAPDPDLESNHSRPEYNSSCDGEETELKTQTSQSKDDYSEREEDTNSEVMKLDTGDNDFPHGHSGRDDVTLGLNRDLDDRKQSETPCEEEVASNMNGCPDQSGADQNTDTERESVDAEEKEGGINRTPAEFAVLSDCYEEVSVSVSTAVSLELSTPVEGSTVNTDHEMCVQREQVNSRTDRLEGYQQGAADPGVIAKGELDLIGLSQPEPDCAAAESDTVNTNRKPLFSFQNAGNGSALQEREASSQPPGHRDPSFSETDGRNVTGNDSDCGTTELNRAGPRDELVLGHREAELHEGDTEEKEDTSGEILTRECTRVELENADGKGDKERNTEGPANESSTQEDNDKKGTEHCAHMDNWRIEESAGGCRGRGKEVVVDTRGQSTHVEATGETGSAVACADPPTSLALSLANPAPTFQPLSSMETRLHCLDENVEKETVGVLEGDEKGSQEGKKRLRRLSEERGEAERGEAERGEAERVSTVATDEEEGKEEEDEFGVFMQAEGEPAWSEGSTAAPVPCGSRGRVAHGSHAPAGEPTHWTPGWTDSLIHQSDDTWTAFPQDRPDEGGDMVGQWWPTSAVEERREPANQNLAAVFAAAFPSSSDEPGDLQTVPALSQLLRGRASQEQGLLDTFHDLNKMICQKYKRGNGVSRDLLLRTFHLERPRAESRPPQRTANHRLSPGLPSTNQHAHNAAAKRRLSYDHNRNME